MRKLLLLMLLVCGISFGQAPIQRDGTNLTVSHIGSNDGNSTYRLSLDPSGQRIGAPLLTVVFAADGSESGGRLSISQLYPVFGFSSGASGSYNANGINDVTYRIGDSYYRIVGYGARLGYGANQGMVEFSRISGTDIIEPGDTISIYNQYIHTYSNGTLHIEGTDYNVVQADRAHVNQLYNGVNTSTVTTEGIFTTTATYTGNYISEWNLAWTYSWGSGSRSSASRDGGITVRAHDTHIRFDNWINYYIGGRNRVNRVSNLEDVGFWLGHIQNQGDW